LEHSHVLLPLERSPRRPGNCRPHVRRWAVADGRTVVADRSSPMTAPQLRRLSPRAWQERYGEEFLATVGDGALRFQQVIDIVSGAIDARFSSDGRRGTRST